MLTRWLHIIFSLLTITASAQQFVTIESADEQVYASTTEPHPGADKLPDILKTIQLSLIGEGYLEAGFDTSYVRNDTQYHHLWTGGTYEWVRLDPGNVNERILAETGYREKLYQKKQINVGGLVGLFNDVLTEYENRGYPMARLQLVIDRWDESGLEGHLQVDKHQFYSIDSLIVKGYDQANRRYLENAIQIKPGDPFNRALLQNIALRIKEVPFLQQVKPPEVVFRQGGKADLYLYLKKRNANRFNGILGVLPDEQTGKITITGEAKLDLLNALFNAGEEIHLKWRKLQTQTQELKTSFHIPYLLQLPIGIGAKFDLYKRDSTYLELSPTAEIRYQLTNRSYFSVYYNNYQSRLLDPSQFQNSTTLPAFNDTRKSTVGVNVAFERLDYRLNPRKGGYINIRGGAGVKQIIQLDSLDPEIYEDVNLRSTQYELEGSVGYYIPLFKRFTWFFGGNGGWLINENLFANEMKRLGGIQSFRGFDDQSILASAYAVGTSEFRFLLEQNSYLYAFVDYGYYENSTSEAFITDDPMGIGLGISFQTKPGIFTINYALGKQQGNPFLFRAAKIHFGFVNYF